MFDEVGDNGVDASNDSQRFRVAARVRREDHDPRQETEPNGENVEWDGKCGRTNEIINHEVNIWQIKWRNIGKKLCQILKDTSRRCSILHSADKYDFLFLQC